MRPSAAALYFRGMPLLRIHASPDRFAAGRIVAIPAEGLVLSRARGQGLVIDDPGIAHGHARFDLTVHGLVLTDGGSGLGTWAIGVPVTRVSLRPGDQVQVGSTLFVVQGDQRPTPAPVSRPGSSPRRRSSPWAACCLSVLALVVLLSAGGAFIVHRYGLPWVNEQLGLEKPATGAGDGRTGPREEVVPEVAGSPQESGTESTGRVTPGGGHQAFSLGDQVTVVVPPGAVDAPADLVIRPADGVPEAGWSAMRAGRVFDVSVSGRTLFKKPLALTLSYDPDLVPKGADPALSVAAAYYDEGSREWVVVPAAVDTARRRVAFLTEHLCKWTVLYRQLGWETHASRHFNIVHRPVDAIAFLKGGQKGSLFADRFVKDLGEWLDQAYEAYEKQGFTMPGFELVPAEAPLSEARVVPPATLPGFERLIDGAGALILENRKVPIWAFVGSATAYWGSQAQEAAWNPKSGNILFPTGFDSPEVCRHEASHELFHAVQNRYFNIASMAVRRWWVEATADYAAARIAIGETGPAPNMGAAIKPRYLERCISFLIPDDKGDQPDSFHEYSTAHFVDYLVSRGAGFKAMWDAVARPGLADLTQVLDPLDKHLKERFGEKRGLAAFYADFARFYLFDPASPLRLKAGETLRSTAATRLDTLDPGASAAFTFSLEPSFTARLWSVKPKWDANRPTRKVKVTAPRRAAGVSLFLYRLPEGRRLAGGGGFEAELGDKPLVLSIGQDDHLLVLAVRAFEGGKASAEVRMEDLAEPAKVKAPPPAPAARRGLELQMVLYVSYDRGYQDEKQRWPASGFQPFENTGWRGFVLSGSGHFTGTRLDGDKESRVEGTRTASAVTKLKWINHRLTKRPNGEKIQEEWWEIELENIPVTPHDPNEYILEGYDASTGKWNTGFEKSVPRLEHKVVFYPSGTSIALKNVFWQRTMAKSIGDMEGFAVLAERPHIRLYFTGP